MFTFIFKISRPRFWLYLAGPYLVGYVAGIDLIKDFLNLWFFIYFFFFLSIANIFLYGVNDYFDQDTDRFNEKKITHEHLLQQSEQKKLKNILFICSGLFLLIGFFAHSQLLNFLWALFFFLSFFYSSPPLRFKARPILDFSSNILYGLPGLIGYAQTTGHLPEWPLLLAIFCWTGAMHLFSAIPDIDSDTRAQLKTTAVIFGKNSSLKICFFLWSISSVLVITFVGLLPFGLIALAYPLLSFFLVSKPTLTYRAYWYFPIINAFLGFIIFLYTLLTLGV